MVWRPARTTLFLLLMTACVPSSSEPPPPLDVAQMPPIRLAVTSIEVASTAQYPADMNFIARRRSEQLSQEAQKFLQARLQATGGADFARATVEEATIVERARTTDGSMLSTAPTWEMVGVLALKVAIVDGLGIEQSYATARAEIKRSLPQRTGIEAKDNLTQTLTNDLILATSRELEQSIDQNMADRRVR